MVSDDPTAYENAAGFDFIKAVPTAWDDTRFVGGTPESHIILARRKGTRWYLGAMTNEQARSVAIPLTFLGSGTYKATVWQDGAGPNDVERTTRKVGMGETLAIKMAVGGGATAIFEPIAKRAPKR
jgi:alpha-glucosidase